MDSPKTEGPRGISRASRRTRNVGSASVRNDQSLTGFEHALRIHLVRVPEGSERDAILGGDTRKRFSPADDVGPLGRSSRSHLRRWDVGNCIHRRWYPDDLASPDRFAPPQRIQAPQLLDGRVVLPGDDPERLTVADAI